MIIIGICGGTASGKSTFSQKLIEYLNAKKIKSDYLLLDNYYRDLKHLSIEERELVNFDDPKNVKMENGFCKVQEAATGMMLVKREVFRTMMKKFPERKYTSDQIVNGKSYSSDNCYDLFCAGIYETNGVKRYLSEDYYFSRLWQECGGDIWADIAMPLTHFGNRAFKGHVGSSMSPSTPKFNTPARSWINAPRPANTKGVEATKIACKMDDNKL